MCVVNETVNSFNSEYNLGKEVNKDLLQYSRPTVERYLFSKLFDKLFAMYAIKNKHDDELFQDRSRLIKEMEPHEVLKYLGVHDKFLLKKEECKNLEMAELSDRGHKKLSHTLKRVGLPYIDAIREIEKI